MRKLTEKETVLVDEAAQLVIKLLSQDDWPYQEHLEEMISRIADECNVSRYAALLAFNQYVKTYVNFTLSAEFGGEND